MQAKQIIPQLNPSIFRAYDIRGVVDDTLTEENIFLLGKAIATLVLEKGERQIALARDGRLSGPKLFQALCGGVVSTGVDALILGVVPTPVLYFATQVLNVPSGVMLTGSHNPSEYNGLKIMISGASLAEEEIQDLYHRTMKQQFAEGQGSMLECEVLDRYLNTITSDMNMQRPLKIAIDAGNGVAGFVAADLYKRLGCVVDELYCDIDGHFPNHHPDPSQAENLKDLRARVLETQADVGIAFDGDGDRLGVVTSSGEIIWPDRQLMFFAQSILSSHPESKILYDVKCTRNLATFIRAHGGQPIMWKTGHSLIKAKLAETQALLAGEMSGHLFFRDRWHGCDDAIYAGARLLEILSQSQESSHHLFATIPNSVNTPELKVQVADSEKFSLMSRLIQQAQFAEAEDINMIDGIRVTFSQGWGLLRPSNTTPCLVLRFEADNETMLTKIQNTFREWMLSVEPDLALPF